MTADSRRAHNLLGGIMKTLLPLNAEFMYAVTTSHHLSWILPRRKNSQDPGRGFIAYENEAGTHSYGELDTIKGGRISLQRI